MGTQVIVPGHVDRIISIGNVQNDMNDIVTMFYEFWERHLRIIDNQLDSKAKN